MAPRAVRERWNNIGKDVVVVHQFNKGLTCPSPSPFPIKLETFLRIAGIKYENDHEYWRSKKGKSPWITVNGTDVADSQLIIEYLKKNLKKDINSHLSVEDAALSRAFQVTVDERFYWCVAIDRYVFDKGAHFHNVVYFGIPKFLFKALMKFEFVPGMKKMAHGHGIGRHSVDEIKKIALDDIRAFGNYLGTKSYLFGDAPTEADCSLFGMLCMVIYCVPEDNFMKVEVENHPNLVQFTERMKEQYWPDWDECMDKPKKKD